MSVNRREFLAASALAAAGVPIGTDTLARSFAPDQSGSGKNVRSPQAQKSYGSGYFGDWIEDEFGLPAFRYTCDQINDPKAKTEVNPGILSSTEHIHQVGNDRIVAIASNYGHVRVRQDEGAPKFLNDYAPERGQFAGGFGYLTDGQFVLSTFYPGNAKTFDRVFGIGYFRRVSRDKCGIDQVILAPSGDDPALISQVTITNRASESLQLRWIEYWGCQIYQFSFRSFMEGFSGKHMHQFRRDFGARFQHSFIKTADRSGLL